MDIIRSRYCALCDCAVVIHECIAVGFICKAENRMQMPKLNPPACAQAKQQQSLIRPTAVKAGTLPLDLLQAGLYKTATSHTTGPCFSSAELIIFKIASVC